MAYDNDYDYLDLGEKVIVIVSSHSLGKFVKIIKTNDLPDSKRLQTITVDYKRLFNG